MSSIVKLNFEDIELLEFKVRQTIHILNSKLENFEILDPLPIYNRSISNKVHYVIGNLHSFEELLIINRDIVDSLIESHEKANYIALLDKYKERLNDLSDDLFKMEYKLQKSEENIIVNEKGKVLSELSGDSTDDEARHKLFSNGSRSKNSISTNMEKLSVDEKVLKTNQQITSNLEASLSVMESNVFSSDVMIEDFQNSTKSLNRLVEQYQLVGQALTSSKNLVNELKKADHSDLQKMKLALAWFAAVCVWILYRRIFKYPIRLLLWFIASLFGLVRTKKAETIS